MSEEIEAAVREITRGNFNHVNGANAYEILIPLTLELDQKNKKIADLEEYVLAKKGSFENYQQERIKGLKEEKTRLAIDTAKWANFFHESDGDNDKLKEENEKLKQDAREVCSTTWRFIGAYKKENGCDIGLALKSAEFHLEQLDYVFNDEEIKGGE